jgi:hypothetical protein
MRTPMSRFAIVIKPDDDDDQTHTGGVGQVIIKVRTDAPTPRITEMTIQSSDPLGLLAGGLPGVDLEAVIRALATGIGLTVVDESGPLVGGNDMADGGTKQQHGLPGPSELLADASPTGAPMVAGAPEHEGPDLPSAGTPVVQPTGQRPATHVAVDGPDAVTSPSRVYRRMPDLEEVLATFKDVGGVTKLAQHYGVPRHTAQGWMARARKMSSGSSGSRAPRPSSKAERQ